VNYGLWMSAAGLATEVHRQDVIANNVANADTVAFKPDLSYTRERPVAREELGATTPAKFLLERLGGGVLAADTITDFAQGDLRQTGGTTAAGSSTLTAARSSRIAVATSPSAKARS
jgi:flagellar basal-body rod protein FlgF